MVVALKQKGMEVTNNQMASVLGFVLGGISTLIYYWPAIEVWLGNLN